MLYFVCVNAGNYLGRGQEYVEILHNSIMRNLPEMPGKFVCFTDDPAPYHSNIEKRPLRLGLTGWWHKLYLFKDGHFADGDKVIYIDLDTCITNGLDEIIKYDGRMAILRDFYRHDGLQSSVMIWPANTVHIWDYWVSLGQPRPEGGDQTIIEQYLTHFKVDVLQDLFPRQFVSYKISAHFDIPPDARMVIFHGEPRPHEVTHNWVPYIWKINGGSILEQKNVGNTADDVVLQQIRTTLELGHEHLADQYSVKTFKSLCICGGGPSLTKDLPELRQRQNEGQIIWALNNTFNYLIANDICPDAQIMLDARPENAAFVPTETIALLLYASQCHAAVFTAAQGKKVIVWDRYIEGLLPLLEEFKIKSAIVGSGSSVGINAMALAQVFGFRDVHLFGYDSSYLEEANHAYPQALNDGEKRMVVTVNGQDFNAAPWMASQVQDFKNSIPNFVRDGMAFHVHGFGLLPYVAHLMSMPSQTQMEKKDEHWWPTDDVASRQVSALEADEEIPELLKLCTTFDLCVQAGGNVGVWAKRLAKHFTKVMTFEPDETNFACLVKNIENAPNIYATQAALGDTPAFVEMYRDKTNCGAHYIEGSGQIPLTTLDYYALPTCSLLLLDVEGYEMKALEGAEQTIRRCLPLIVCEEKGLGKKYGIADDAITSFLLGLDYTIAKRVSNDVIYRHKSQEPSCKI